MNLTDTSIKAIEQGLEGSLNMSDSVLEYAATLVNTISGHKVYTTDPEVLKRVGATLKCWNELVPGLLTCTYEPWVHRGLVLSFHKRFELQLSKDLDIPNQPLFALARPCSRDFAMFSSFHNGTKWAKLKWAQASEVERPGILIGVTAKGVSLKNFEGSTPKEKEAFKSTVAEAVAYRRSL